MCKTKTAITDYKLVNRMKIPLKVNADFDLSGKIVPRSIEWEDGRVFAVDRVLDVRRAASCRVAESRGHGAALHLPYLRQDGGAVQ